MLTIDQAKKADRAISFLENIEEMQEKFNVKLDDNEKYAVGMTIINAPSESDQTAYFDSHVDEALAVNQSIEDLIPQNETLEQRSFRTQARLGNLINNFSREVVKDDRPEVVSRKKDLCLAAYKAK